MTLAREPGRRELNKADKQRRILAAARDLFFRNGYSSVTTQEVADQAEVGTGTLFRYAQSKGELLCMVANEEFRAMVETVPDTGDPVEDLVTLCDPLFSALENQPENIVAYHRETVFGEPGPHRAEAQRILGNSGASSDSCSPGTPRGHRRRRTSTVPPRPSSTSCT